MINHCDTVLSRMLRYDAGERPIPGPSRLTFFPTNICNLKCEHCWRVWADYDKTFKSEMSDQRLLDLVEETYALGIDQWYFVGGGDPMARGKTVMSMCKRIRELNMQAGIHTNGTLFKKGMIEQVVETGMESIIVSLDGPNAEINDRIRSGGFAKATASLKRFADLKLVHRTKYPETVIYATVTNLTYDKIDEYAELAASLGPSISVSISTLIIEGEGCKQFEMSAEQKAAFPEHLHKGIERAKELGVENNFRLYLEPEITEDDYNRNAHLDGKTSDDVADAMCFEPWGSMIIFPNGQLGPCCAFDGADDALSIKDAPLAEVWRGAYMESVRAGMLNGKPPSYCVRCPSNLYLEKEGIRKVCKGALRRQRKWKTLGPAGKAQFLAARSVQSLRDNGIPTTIARGIEKVRKKHAAKKIARTKSSSTG